MTDSADKTLSGSAEPPLDKQPDAAPDDGNRLLGLDLGKVDSRVVARWLGIGIPIATAVVALGAGVLLGPSTTILILAGGMLVGVIATFWASIRTLAGETPLAGADAYALGAPRAEEEKKRAVLRALKDLEFERNVGKISEEDYRVLVAKYRAEAKRLLRLLDEEAAPRRKQAEALVAARLRKEGMGAAYREASSAEAPPKRGKGKKRRDKAAAAAASAAAPAAEAPLPIAAADEAPAAPEEPATKEDPAGRACAKCGTANDDDAVFCKKCGARQIDDAAASDAGETEDAAT